MKRNILLRTNIFICIVIILGFSLASLISRRTDNSIFMDDIEQISALTSKVIYHQLDSIFSKPVNIALTMANDSLLKTYLTEEQTRGSNGEFVHTMQDYLYAYKEKYGYESVFLISARTNRYYHFDSGVDRILKKGNLENEWYYSFLESPKEYSLNIDNDEVPSAGNEINIFINCKIFSPDGKVMGIVGVGFRAAAMQELFQEYENLYHLRAYLVDSDGMVEISTDDTKFAEIDLFEAYAFGEYREAILSSRKAQSFWYSSEDKKGFLVSSYIPNLEWYLIIDNNTSVLEARLYRQLFMDGAILIIVIGAVLLVTTSILRRFNTYIVNLTVEKEKARRSIFQEETTKLYENIYEIDITHGQPASEAAEGYFESLGVPKNMPYDKALYMIAEKQIKEEYREGYIRTFSPDNVLNAYEKGEKSLCYDFMLTSDGGSTYYWMRITARIFYWEEDKSVRMVFYHQNIDSEKQRELLLIEKMQRDFITSLYNKAAAQDLIRSLLMEAPGQSYAFFILDIDNFKTVNDTYGHAFGDQVIEDFSHKIKGQFGEEDIVGRIGGDEFVVFVPAPSMDWVERKAKALSRELSYEFSNSRKYCTISASIGVAVSPQAGTSFESLYQNGDLALYQTKENGKNGYTVYRSPTS